MHSACWVSPSWRLRTGERDPRIEHSALKTIAGFLNASGGTLIIGVADDGVPVGIQEDGNTERFYVRTGASTTELTPSQANEYVGQRFRAGA
ncbi:MAG: ATP-binding protein [Actinobacteria bacterium]|nr:ATP-binding protein [Actinomycetota bacterium]